MSSPSPSRRLVLFLAGSLTLALAPLAIATADTLSPDATATTSVITLWHRFGLAREYHAADGDSIHLKAMGISVDPDSMYVTENVEIDLDEVDVQAGAAWYPAVKEKDLEARGLPTKITWEVYLDGKVAGTGQTEITGVPTRKEWKDWYFDEGPYPHAAENLTNERRRVTLRIRAIGEAFDEGTDQVYFKLMGETYVWRNEWSPDDWRHNQPVEWTELTPVTTGFEILRVDPPYEVFKTPPIDESIQNHIASLTVQLIDRNLARNAYIGNVQDYENPTIVFPGANGQIGTDGQLAVRTVTHSHVGTHPPEKVHVLPDFDPISVEIIHREWDVPDNRGKEYRRTPLLNPTELYCVQPGDTSSVPAAPDPAPITGGSAEGQNTRRTIASQGAVIEPVPGQPEPARGTRMEVRILPQSSAEPVQNLSAIPDGSGDWYCHDCAVSGDQVVIEYWLRDLFGQHYEDTIVVDIPDSTDLAAPDTVWIPQPVLEPTLAEVAPEPSLVIDVRVLDLAAAPFGVVRGLAGMQVDDVLGGVTGTTDEDGRFTFEVPHGVVLGMTVADPIGAYLSLALPPTPPLENHLALRETGPEGWQDDRMHLWLTPSFALARLHPATGLVDVDDGLFTSHVGAVSDFAPEEILDARWETFGGDFLLPANIRPWGASPREDIGYVPVLFALTPPPGIPGDDPLYQAVLQAVVDGGGARLVVATVNGTDHAVEIPYEEGVVSGVDRTPRALALNLRVAPNPFNPMTKISFDLPDAGPVKLEILNLEGRRIATLADGRRGAGPQEITWRGRDDRGAEVASGVYFARLRAVGIERSVKLVLVR